MVLIVNNTKLRSQRLSWCVGVHGHGAPSRLKGTYADMEQHMLPSRQQLFQGHSSLFLPDDTKPCETILISSGLVPIETNQNVDGPISARGKGVLVSGF